MPICTRSPDTSHHVDGVLHVGHEHALLDDVPSTSYRQTGSPASRRNSVRQPVLLRVRGLIEPLAPAELDAAAVRLCASARRGGEHHAAAEAPGALRDQQAVGSAASRPPARCRGAPAEPRSSRATPGSRARLDRNPYRPRNDANRIALSALARPPADHDGSGRGGTGPNTSALSPGSRQSGHNITRVPPAYFGCSLDQITSQSRQPARAAALQTRAQQIDQD